MQHKTWKITAIILGVVLILITAVIGFSIIFYNKDKIINLVSATPTIVMQGGESIVYGYIYSSGISQSDTKFAKKSNYQVTYLNSVDSIILPKAYQDKLSGLFLIGDESSFDSNWGQCVEIRGNLTTDIGPDNLQDYYDRAFIKVTQISKSTKCSSIAENYPDYQDNMLTVSGQLARNERPSPDINYDYQLMLDKPYDDKDTASGLETTISIMVIQPKTKELLLSLNSNMGKRITVSGNWIWGYSESKFLIISNLK